MEVERIAKPTIENGRYRQGFPGVKALDKAFLELNEGEVVGLVGENGAGKSTLMNVLGGIHKPDGGKIYIDEKEVTN